MADESSDDDLTLSIGAVSEATGIPPSTLRTWERRYGFPDPDRTEAGHRRYPPSVVSRLQLVDRALDEGHRPSDVVALDDDSLRSLVDTAPSDTPSAPESPEEPSEPTEPTEDIDTDDDRGGDTSTEPASDDSDKPWLAEWMTATRQLDGDRLTSLMRTSWNRLGGLAFLKQRCTPFLRTLGASWADGDLGIVHEHYTSEYLEDFLSSHWRSMNARPGAPSAVCATLEDEDHVLGLHMSALVLAMAGWHISFLGARTPIEEIGRAVELEDADAVVVSFSANVDRDRAEAELDELEERFDELTLVVGGGGAPTPHGGALNFDDLESFYHWAYGRARNDDA